MNGSSLAFPLSRAIQGVVLLLGMTTLAPASPPPRGDVQPAELAEWIDKADRLVVFESPRPDAAVLFESVERRDLDALKTALRVVRPEKYEHCMCDGTPAVVLCAKGQKIAEITNHHAKRLRFSQWKSDARIVDAQALLKWFDERKIPGPREEYESAIKSEKERNEAEKKWIVAMPSSLKPHWEAAKEEVNRPNIDLSPLKKALEAQIPDKNERILALYSWFGSSMGPWSGFPGYQVIAEGMLLEYSTPELLAAIERRELSLTQTEGVARLFSCGRVSRQDCILLLPAELKIQLRKHVDASGNEDKSSRAQTFGGF